MPFHKALALWKGTEPALSRLRDVASLRAVHLTREDDGAVRWRNALGVAAVGAFLVWEVFRPAHQGPSSPAFWVALSIGAAGVVLTPTGVRLRFGRRPGRLP